MTDGAVARKTNSNSPLGARLDTAADFLFAAVSLAKLLSRISISKWMWIWIAAIAIIKIANAAVGVVFQKRFVAVHSIMNKITGLLLFIFPFTLNFIQPKYSSVILCSVASFSAIQEGYFIVTKKGE